ncbi:LOW QUALITY PROTEIN: nucleolar and spindle-associated protein 1 [Leucoraja erinacea]|uniref:LOW QUALITY PROTEIN: nucleolar and spindle-associated protein 1 n=1 Tax=Leucoraja erinaceus TaxID=7782 RepID=UPI00245728F9|nr:LOW QUALITY PROTEIN: nucleolar and spindle-associated protein 1 [Leucoraja erinacea]
MELSGDKALQQLKYSDLQQLAKQCGVKANLKADKLCKLLQDYYKKHPKDVADVQASEDDKSITPVLEKGEDSYVTKRRGKGRLSNESKEGQKDNQNESGHQQECSAIEQPSQEVSPLSESCQNTEGSGSKRKPRKRHAEFEDFVETGDERSNTENAAVTQCKPLPSEETTATSKGTVGQSKTFVQGGKIPRYIGGARKTGLKTPVGGKTGLMHVTPDWKKIHEANFNKMESIDLYVERKKKRLEAIGNCVKPVKKSLNGPQSMSLLSPVQRTTKNTQLTTPASQFKLPRTSVFKPSVHSVTKMNVRFSKATRDNEEKETAAKTPAKMSPCTEISSDLGTEEMKINKSSQPRTSKDQGDTSTMERAQTKVVTPYKFSGNATPGSNKRFDLQASLSQPLRYKPHKGKLKPWEEEKEKKEIVVAQNPQNSRFSVQNYKQPKLQTRENRREKFIEKRKEIKNHVMGTRRGLVMH